ncbi:hypothetical protein C8Q73DRAFT_670721 [Cubamyces lactineus]|nr:hypothetical protein C8Q73DRAFT_670721 [Cubamyces lactineus]
MSSTGSMWWYASFQIETSASPDPIWCDLCLFPIVDPSRPSSQSIRLAVSGRCRQHRGPVSLGRCFSARTYKCRRCRSRTLVSHPRPPAPLACTRTTSCACYQFCASRAYRSSSPIRRLHPSGAPVTALRCSTRLVRSDWPSPGTPTRSIRRTSPSIVGGPKQAEHIRPHDATQT